MDFDALLQGIFLTWKLNPRLLQLPALAFFPDGLHGKESACSAGDLVRSLGWEDTLEKEMATHSRILAWRIPWTEKPGRLVRRVTNSWT